MRTFKYVVDVAGQDVYFCTSRKGAQKVMRDKAHVNDFVEIGTNLQLYTMHEFIQMCKRMECDSAFAHFVY